MAELIALAMRLLVLYPHSKSLPRGYHGEETGDRQEAVKAKKE